MIRPIALVLIMLTFSNLAWAELDKLFFSPDERRMLDLARERAARPQGADTTSAVVDGMVRRSDGQNTIWINGRPFQANQRLADKAAALPLEQSTSLRIKVTKPVDLAGRDRDASRRAGAQ